MSLMKEMFKSEIREGSKWATAHKNDYGLVSFLYDLKQKEDEMTHDERWSELYDYIKKKYPEVPGYIITGLSYWIEKD